VPTKNHGAFVHYESLKADQVCVYVCAECAINDLSSCLIISFFTRFEKVSENQAPASKQGVRCFQTLYAPNDGYVMEWGTTNICINISTIIIAIIYFRKGR